MRKDPKTCPYFETAKSISERMLTVACLDKAHPLERRALQTSILLALVDAWDTGWSRPDDLPRDRPVPMDDPAVKEVLADLQREITRGDLDALASSLKEDGLEEVWLRRVTCERTQCPPIEGETWGHWLAVLARWFPLRPVLEMLSDAEVLGTTWTKVARERVWEEKGWK